MLLKQYRVNCSKLIQKKTEKGFSHQQAKKLCSCATLRRVQSPEFYKKYNHMHFQNTEIIRLGTPKL